MKKLFYIQSLERGVWGNDAVWWRPDSAGYTASLDEAGKYTEEEAKERFTDEDIPIECSLIDAIAHRSADFSKVRQLRKNLSERAET